MSGHRTNIGFNFTLALRLAWKSLGHHRMIGLATVLGVAMGMCVVSTILIVDYNTARDTIAHERLADEIASPGLVGIHGEARRVIRLPITRVQIIKQPGPGVTDPSSTRASVSPQRLEHPVTRASRPRSKGEEDYQTMRLAIRMASLFAFFIGAVIVFYTMRFSVTSRLREFALLMCLGESQRNVALSLLIESLILGAIGTLLGVLSAYPTAQLLLGLGISTTGRTPLAGFSLPLPELSVMALVSVSVALLGVVAPIRSIYRLQLAQVLQPRYMDDGINARLFRYTGYSWLIPPLLLSSYLVIRPFLEDWLSVVYFFVSESLFILVLTLVTIWWTRPFLRFCVRLIESALKNVIPLETLLTVRRIRLTSHKFVFSITGVILVFSLLSSLHAITRSLKDEIYSWSQQAMTPYYFYTRDRRIGLNNGLNQEALENLEEQHGIHVVRLSAKSRGSFPVRLINADDFNRVRLDAGLAPFAIGQVIFSKTLAARFGVELGDRLRLDASNQVYHFDVIEIGDSMGTFAEDGQYVDIKSFALFSDGNPLFRDNLERTLGAYAVVASSRTDRPTLTRNQKHLLSPYYQFHKAGRDLKHWQMREIDKDFMIFDFILIMTIMLAFIGIINTLLIQVHSRARELSVLKTLGISRMQTIRLLLAEGFVIGLIGALLTVLLGTALGMVSVSFLDRFTLFDYHYVWSIKATLLVSLFAIFTCCLSAIYPAIVATRIGTAESLHYE